MQIRITPAVKYLLIACFSAFVLQHTIDQFLGGNIQGVFALVPSGFIIQHRLWQLFTYVFLHADVMHLFLNLMMLVFIGGELEAFWGTARFLRFFFICTTAAGLLYLFLQFFVWGGSSLEIPMVGASGGIYGLLMAYGLIFGERVLLFMMLFPMKAKHFVWILVAIEFMSTVFSGRGGLANAAHLGGMIAGAALLWGKAVWSIYQKTRGSGGFGGGRGRGSGYGGRSKSKRSADHLKLVVNKPGSRPAEDTDPDGRPRTWH